MWVTECVALLYERRTGRHPKTTQRVRRQDNVIPAKMSRSPSGRHAWRRCSATASVPWAAAVTASPRGVANVASVLRGSRVLYSQPSSALFNDCRRQLTPTGLPRHRHCRRDHCYCAVLLLAQIGARRTFSGRLMHKMNEWIKHLYFMLQSIATLKISGAVCSRRMALYKCALIRAIDWLNAKTHLLHFVAKVIWKLKESNQLFHLLYSIYDIKVSSNDKNKLKWDERSAFRSVQICSSARFSTMRKLGHASVNWFCQANMVGYLWLI